jgi:hypothetical protein
LINATQGSLFIFIMQENIQVFTYEEQQIEFDLSGVTLMVNATEMAKAFNSRPVLFLENEQTIKFLEAAITDKRFSEILEFDKKNYMPKIASESRNSDFQTSNFTPQQRQDYLLKVVKGGKHSGTWMHPILALYFATWLNPDFHVWVYLTILRLMKGVFNEYDDSLCESAIRQVEIQKLKDDLSKKEKQSDEYKKIADLIKAEKQAAAFRSKINNRQLNLFKQNFAQ